MRRKLLSLALAGVVSVSASLTATAATGNASQQVHRPFYGYFTNNAIFQPMQWGIALQYFDEPEATQLIYDYGAGNKFGVYAGTGVDGILYFCEYEFVSLLEQPQPRNLVTYNTFNGRRTEIGKWNPDDSQFKPVDMTYDYTSGKMYAIGFEDGLSGLYEVNTETAVFTKLCSVKQGATLAAAPDGQLYTIGLDGILYTVDKTSGALVKIFDTHMTGMMSMQTMEFDRTNGKLYWASNCTSNDPYDIWLQEIDLSDPDNITMNPVGTVGLEAQFVGMYIPAASSFDAPAAPDNIKVVTENPDVLDAKISWKNPTTTFGGDKLSSINGVVLLRDGEQIKVYTDVQPGQELTFTDDKVKSYGEYRYDIMAFNAKGDGMKGTIFAYVGQDAPGVPTDVEVSVNDDFLGATVSWVAPTVGKHEGAFKAGDIKYNVVRRPDNLKIAEGVTGTSVNDNNFRRLLSYSYDIEAYNDYGSSIATSTGKLIGPAMEELDEYFEDYSAIPNKWMVVDANDDTFTWIFNTTVSHDVFGDYETAAQYILTPTSVDSRLQPADDWLISGPVKFDPAKQYQVVLYARCAADDPQMVEICYGKNTEVASMTKIGEAEVKVNPDDPVTGTMSLATYVADIPKGESLGCVGFHLVAPIPGNNSCFLQLAHIKIQEKGAGAVGEISADNDIVVSVSGKVLTISGSFANAALYSVDGRKVAAVNSAITDLGSLASGVYVVTVDGKSYKFVL